MTELNTTEYFDIDSYLESLPKTTICINLQNKCIPYLPDLSKFTNLVNLTCSNCGLNEIHSLPSTLFLLNLSMNNLTSLPELPPNLEALSVANNQLTRLPELPLYLIGLICDGNKLVELPRLHNTLYALYCNNNQLKWLPPLPKHLGSLKCANNHLGYIPLLPDKLDSFWIENLENNPVYDMLDWNIPMGYDWNMINIRKKVVTMNRFRELYYCLKFRNKLRNILWKKIREPKIQSKYHPDNLRILLENVHTDNDFDSVINKW